jgi:2-polyprenyl-3-methyl-5-hydroxy-6-metoxy-1,4-benzoquinol methylase
MTTTTTTTITSKSGRSLRIRVMRVGCNHGFWSELIARNGRLVAEVGAYGTREAAEQAAADRAARI